MQIKIGSYYKTHEGELVYAFGTATFDEHGSMACRPGEKELDPFLVNVLAMKVMDRIAKEGHLDFSISVRDITVDSRTMVPVSKWHGWSEVDPDPDVVSRFEQTSHFLGIIEKYIQHMKSTYHHKFNRVIARKVVA